MKKGSKLTEEHKRKIGDANRRPNPNKACFGPRPNWKYKYGATAEESRRNRNRKTNAIRFFGITIEEYDNYFKEQKECQICGSVNRLRLDHCHKTNAIRGVLCHSCNVALGLFKDNQEVMANAIKYLKK